MSGINFLLVHGEFMMSVQIILMKMLVQSVSDLLMGVPQKCMSR